jgi:hypothetical protein
MSALLGYHFLMPGETVELISFENGCDYRRGRHAIFVPKQGTIDAYLQREELWPAWEAILRSSCTIGVRDE